MILNGFDKLGMSIKLSPSDNNVIPLCTLRLEEKNSKGEVKKKTRSFLHSPDVAHLSSLTEVQYSYVIIMQMRSRTTSGCRYLLGEWALRENPRWASIIFVNKILQEGNQ